VFGGTVRKVLLIFLSVVVLGGSGGSTALGSDRVHGLLLGIFQDVGAILTSFAGGPDDPNGPVSNFTTLRIDSERLQSATQKADQLATELNRLQTQNTPAEYGH
jgi:hypothetical protein